MVSAIKRRMGTLKCFKGRREGRTELVIRTEFWEL